MGAKFSTSYFDESHDLTINSKFSKGQFGNAMNFRIILLAVLKKLSFVRVRG